MSYYNRRDMWKVTKEKVMAEHPEQFETFGNLTIRKYDDKNGLQVWKKKAVVPFVNYIFKTPEQREKYLSDVKISETKSQQYNAEQRAKNEMRRAEFKNKLEVGTILYSSWGYDQTNIDFYQVIEKKNESVTIRPIASRNVRDAGFMSNYVAPIKDHFTGEAQLKRIGCGGITLKSYSSAWIWDKEEILETHYA